MEWPEHFMQRGMLTQYAASKNVPAPGAAVALSGLLILLGGASVLLGAWPVVGCTLIALFLLGVSPRMHNFWAITDPNQKMADMINFTKNTALLGAALALMYVPQPWPFSVTLGQ